MKIILDEETLTDSPDTLAEAIALAAQRAAGRGRIVVDIVADGQAVAGEELDDSSSLARACDEVRMTTAEPRSFVRVTLLDASDALEQARMEQRRTAELIEAGSMVDAFQTMAGALGLWQAARQALDQGAQLLGLDLSALPLRRADDLPEAVAELSRCLEEVRRCVGAEDWAGLNDVLLYDLDALAVRWRDLLGRVAEHVADESVK